jgi:uncharacterized membrane protein
VHLLCLFGALECCLEWQDYARFMLDQGHLIKTEVTVMIIAAGVIVFIIPRLKPGGMLPFIFSGAFAAVVFAVTFKLMLMFGREEFRPVANMHFAAGIFAAAILYACSLMYRFIRYDEIKLEAPTFAEVFFAGAIMLAIMTINNELHEHVRVNGEFAASWALQSGSYLRGLLITLLAFAVICVIPKFSAPGIVAVIFSIALLAGAGLFSLHRFEDFGRGIMHARRSEMMVYLNPGFLLGILPAAVTPICLMMIRKRRDIDGAVIRRIVQVSAVAIIIFTWLMLTKEMYLYWLSQSRHAVVSPAVPLEKGQMWISMLWAVYAAVILGIGLWRKIVMLRYIGFAFFTLTVVKVFIYDMHRLAGLYQIAGFILLGIVLIGVSYLYQFLRKQGFFENR